MERQKVNKKTERELNFDKKINKYVLTERHIYDKPIDAYMHGSNLIQQRASLGQQIINGVAAIEKVNQDLTDHENFCKVFRTKMDELKKEHNKHYKGIKKETMENVNNGPVLSDVAVKKEAKDITEVKEE